MQTYNTDVCVIAGGPAGLAAAISAAERGAEVILLEKANTTGGAGNMGMGPLGIGSRLAKGAMADLDAEKAFRIFMDYTHWRVDARLVRAYLEKSGDTIHWLEDMGVRFDSVAKYFPSSQATWHIVKPESGKPGPRAASAMFKAMTDRAVELGVKILYETPAVSLEKSDKGYINAVLAKDSAGNDVRVECLAAIIATGGFGDNPQMIKDRIGYEWGKDLFSFRIPGVVGDGIKMAMDVGAESTDVNIEMTVNSPGLADAGISPSLWVQPKTLVLNNRCERIMNEELLENTTFAGNAVSIQNSRVAYSIVDSRVVDYYTKNGFDVVSLVHSYGLENFEQQAKQARANGFDNLYMADTVEELAAQMGLDEDAFKAAFDEYNTGCRDKEDYFYKHGKHLMALEKAPFYAVRLHPSGYGTLGGIKINYKTEVLSKENKPIEGLYAAGTDACSIFGVSYVFVLPGNTMGFALNSGRIAGESAAAYVFEEE
ncbi:MAG: FAD-dependent oxidoreductase [Defluviitaleaceae bacterium]|nr:FAD-dependent oxidoreductase [Defluviitaleaceae bacterium]